MRAQDGPRDWQPEPGAPGIKRARRLKPDEWFENVFEIGLGDSSSIVVDINANVLIQNGKGNLCAIAITLCISQQVPERG